MQQKSVLLSFLSFDLGKFYSQVYPVWQHTFISPSAFSRRAVVSYWQKYVQEVLVNRLGGLSLPRKSVVRLTDSPDMTLDVYRGCKTTMQQQQKKNLFTSGKSASTENMIVKLQCDRKLLRIAFFIICSFQLF